MRPIPFIAFIALALSFAACKHDPYPAPDDVKEPGDDTTSSGNDCDPDSVYFSNDILPLLSSNCAKAGCHDEATAQEGVVLTNYDDIMETGDVRPGRPDNSDIYEMITENDPDKRMPPPPNTPLDSDAIALIRKWINQGAKDNSCQADCDTSSTVVFSQHIRPIIQQHCAGCHSSANPPKGVDLSDYNSTTTTVNAQTLLGAIRHQPGYTPMPQSGPPLSDCKIRTFELWIENGQPQ